MDEQLDLFGKSKQQKLADLYDNLNYEKLIRHFGALHSKIVILGIAPMQSHIESESKSAFCFDIDLEQTGNSSGAILIKTFKELGLNIEDYFFDNIYKIPVEKLTEDDKIKFRILMDKELDILEIPTIVCLGSECYKEIKNLQLNVNWSIYKIPHPGWVLRGGISFESYVQTWKEMLYEEYGKLQ